MAVAVGSGAPSCCSPVGFANRLGRAMIAML